MIRVYLSYHIWILCSVIFLLWTIEITNCTTVWFFIIWFWINWLFYCLFWVFINCCNVFCKVSSLWTFVITTGAITWLVFFMNWCSVSCQVTLLWRCIVTNWTIKWFFPFMNCINVFYYTSLMRTFVITNWALKWLLFIMNWCNLTYGVIIFNNWIFITFRDNFFISWTDSICLVKSFSCEYLYSQTAHLYGFSSSWTDNKCLFKNKRNINHLKAS